MLRLLTIPGIPLFAIWLSHTIAPLPLPVGIPILLILMAIVCIPALILLLTGRFPRIFR